MLVSRIVTCVAVVWCSRMISYEWYVVPRYHDQRFCSFTHANSHSSKLLAAHYVSALRRSHLMCGFANRVCANNIMNGNADVTKRRKLQPNCSPRKFRIFRIGLLSLYILYFFWCYSQMPPKESFMKYSFPSSRLLWPQKCQCCISHCVATSICSIKSS